MRPIYDDKSGWWFSVGGQPYVAPQPLTTAGAKPPGPDLTNDGERYYDHAYWAATDWERENGMVMVLQPVGYYRAIAAAVAAEVRREERDRVVGLAEAAQEASEWLRAKWFSDLGADDLADALDAALAALEETD